MGAGVASAWWLSIATINRLFCHSFLKKFRGLGQRLLQLWLEKENKRYQPPEVRSRVTKTNLSADISGNSIAEAASAVNATQNDRKYAIGQRAEASTGGLRHFCP